MDCAARRRARHGHTLVCSLKLQQRVRQRHVPLITYISDQHVRSLPLSVTTSQGIENAKARKERKHERKLGDRSVYLPADFRVFAPFALSRSQSGFVWSIAARTGSRGPV